MKFRLRTIEEIFGKPYEHSWFRFGEPPHVVNEMVDNFGEYLDLEDMYYDVNLKYIFLDGFSYSIDWFEEPDVLRVSLKLRA